MPTKLALPTRRPAGAQRLVTIYECLCDETRLRILNLLVHAGRLCVCHFQDLLRKPQVPISKHLRYLREKGVVAATKHANWMLYALADRRSPELESNLRCLQDCIQTHAIFQADLRRLAALQPDLDWLEDVQAPLRRTALRRA